MKKEFKLYLFLFLIIILISALIIGTTFYLCHSKTAPKLSTILDWVCKDKINDAKNERDIYWGGPNKDGSGGRTVELKKVLEGNYNVCKSCDYGNNYCEGSGCVNFMNNNSNCGKCVARYHG